jgi:UDP-N-acetylglucosamine 2-epimerase (non-hydrolysing)
MHVLHVVGARPNLMKAAPVYRALAERGVRQTIVHTGQHYDTVLSKGILEEVGLPEPDANLGVGSGSHAAQTARAMVAVEEHIQKQSIDVLLAYGDVNSTLAAALAAAKLGVPVGHVEAGLRSGDRTMPEEINRMLVDRLSTWLFTPSRDADANLAAEGTDPGAIRLVGNVMIDTLKRLLPLTEDDGTLRRLDLMNGQGPDRFVLVTLHRPSNVDDPSVLGPLVTALDVIASDVPVVFPVHPRTRARIARFLTPRTRTRYIDPLTYLPFLALQRHAAVVVTDSGGVQEETTYLGVPCLTMRTTTERPVTVDVGTNRLLGTDVARLRREVNAVLDGQAKKGRIPDLWDGRAAQRIAAVLS